MENSSIRLYILIGAVVLAVLLVWWMFFTGEGSDDAGLDNAEILRKVKKLAEEGDAEALADEATHENQEYARRSVRAMGRTGPKAVAGVRAAMKDERPKVRQAAMIAISHAGGEEDVPDLATTVLRDDSPEVKAAAAMSLGRLKAYDHVETLLRALEDDSPVVRLRANAAIVEIIGVSGGFNAFAPPEARRKAIVNLRSLWTPALRRKTIQFYTARKAHKKRNAPKD